MKRLIRSVLAPALTLGALLFALSFPIRWNWLGDPHLFGEPIDTPGG